jgi:hypothetical protein
MTGFKVITNATARDHALAIPNRGNNRHRKTQLFSHSLEQVGIASSAMTKSEGISHGEMAHAESLKQEIAHEVLRGHL